MEINPIYRIRNFENGSFIVGPAEAFEINEVGVQIYKAIKEGKKIAEVAKLISNKYDVTIDIATSDIKEFIQYLLNNNLIVSDDSNT